MDEEARQEFFRIHESHLRRYRLEAHSRVAFTRTRDQPLTTYHKRENKRRAQVRARVEHVFGTLETAICGKFMRCIGLQRASIQVGLQNLLYNMHRLVTLERGDELNASS